MITKEEAKAKLMKLTPEEVNEEMKRENKILKTLISEKVLEMVLPKPKISSWDIKKENDNKK